MLESPLDDDCKGNTVTNAIKKLELTSKLKDRLRKISALQKKSRTILTSFETKKLVWDFWHSSSIISTLTNRLAQLRVTSKPKIHDLPFNDSVQLAKSKRNVEIYQDLWDITTKTYLEI